MNMYTKGTTIIDELKKFGWDIEYRGEQFYMYPPRADGVPGKQGIQMDKAERLRQIGRF